MVPPASLSPPLPLRTKAKKGKGAGAGTGKKQVNELSIFDDSGSEEGEESHPRAATDFPIPGAVVGNGIFLNQRRFSSSSSSESPPPHSSVARGLGLVGGRGGDVLDNDVMSGVMSAESAEIKKVFILLFTDPNNYYTVKPPLCNPLSPQ